MCATQRIRDRPLRPQHLLNELSMFSGDMQFDRRKTNVSVELMHLFSPVDIP
jgi:hypothetical protein